MKIIIEVPYETKAVAQSALKAMESELSFQKRASSKMESKGNVVTITVEAKDAASLHAAAGSFLRALKIVEAVQSNKKIK